MNLKKFGAGTAMALVLASGAVALPQRAAAQQAEASAVGGLEEIVVTARRREERLQESPVAVSAFSAATLEERNITDVGGLNGLVPNVTVLQSPSYTTQIAVHVRGIGQADNALTLDPPVALYIDGVYIARAAAGLFDLIDLERAEVLRGPQGTLFGRNTTGGALNIATKAPTDEFGITQKLGYATHNEFIARTVLNTGKIDGGPLKATIAYSHRQMDGYVDNTLAPSSKDPGARNSNAFYLAVRGDFTDNFSLDYRGDYFHQRGVPQAAQTAAVSQTIADYFGQSPNFGGAPLVVNPDYMKRITTIEAEEGKTTVWGQSLTANYEVSDALAFKSITSYRRMLSDEKSPLSGGALMRGLVVDPSAPLGVSVQPINLFEVLCRNSVPQSTTGHCDHQKQRQFTQEVQVSGTLDRFNYVGGFFYFKENVFEEDPFMVTVPVAPGVGFNAFPTTRYAASSRSLAGFGQVSYTPPILDDKLELTAGIRYSKDRKTIHQMDLNSGVPLPEINASRKNSKFNWAGSVSYKWTPDIMTYARVSTAYKAGGFNPRTQNNAFNPETAISYEAGIKSDWFDRTVRVNASGFITRYKNLQVNQFTASAGGASSSVVNAGRAIYRGGELELVVLPFEGLQLDGNIGIVNPIYKQYGYTDPVTFQTSNVADSAKFQYVSKLTYNVGAQYTFPEMPVGVLSARLDFVYQSPKTWHPLNQVNPFNDVIRAGVFTRLDARVTLANIPAGAATVDAQVYSTNLLNKHNRVSGIDFGSLGFANVYYDRPRVVGIMLTGRY